MIAEICHENEIALSFAKESIELASATLSRVSTNENSLVNSFKEINEATFEWLTKSREQYKVKDFGYVFEKYINN